MDFLQSSVFWGVVGILGGFAISAFFFFIGKSRKILEYEISSTQLITEKMTNIPGLKITMDQHPIVNLTSTTIKIKNIGNQTILPSDFATIDPLGVTVSGQFLSITNGHTIKTDNPNASPSLKILDDFTLGIEFDFLKPKKSIYITLLHNGEIILTGELKDGKMRDHDNPLLAIRILSILLFFILIHSVNMFLLIFNLVPFQVFYRINIVFAIIISTIFLFYGIFFGFDTIGQHHTPRS